MYHQGLEKGWSPEGAQCRAFWWRKEAILGAGTADCTLKPSICPSGGGMCSLGSCSIGGWETTLLGAQLHGKLFQPEKIQAAAWTMSL